MSTYNNPSMVAGITPEAAGAIYVDRQVTDLANAAVVPAALAVGDLLQIGVIPAGAVLVPELSTLRLPQIDTGGSGTGAASIGVAGSNAAIAAAQSVTAAKDIRGSGLSFSALPGASVAFGDPDDDTPIYLVLTGALVTQAKTGKVVCDFAFRAYVQNLDP